MAFCDFPFTTREKVSTDIELLIERAKFLSDKNKCLNKQMIDYVNEEKELKMKEIYIKSKKKEIQTILDLINNDDYNEVTNSLDFFIKILDKNEKNINEKIDSLKAKALDICLRDYIIDKVIEYSKINEVNEKKEFPNRNKANNYDFNNLDRELSLSTRNDSTINVNNNLNINTIEESNLFQKIAVEIKDNNNSQDNQPFSSTFPFKKKLIQNPHNDNLSFKIDTSKYMSFANNDKMYHNNNNKGKQHKSISPFLRKQKYTFPKYKPKSEVHNTSKDDIKKQKLKELNERIKNMNMSMSRNIKPIQTKEAIFTEEHSQNRKLQKSSSIDSLSNTSLTSKHLLSIETLSISYISQSKLLPMPNYVYNKKIIAGKKKVLKTQNNIIQISSSMKILPKTNKDKKSLSKSKEKKNIIIVEDKNICENTIKKVTNIKINNPKIKEKNEKLIKQLEEKNRIKKEIEQKKGIIPQNPKYSNVRPKLYDVHLKRSYTPNINNAKKTIKIDNNNTNNSNINNSNTNNTVNSRINNEKKLNESIDKLNDLIEHEPVIQQVDSLNNSEELKNEINIIPHQDGKQKQNKNNTDDKSEKENLKNIKIPKKESELNKIIEEAEPEYSSKERNSMIEIVKEKQKNKSKEVEKETIIIENKEEEEEEKKEKTKKKKKKVQIKENENIQFELVSNNNSDDKQNNNSESSREKSLKEINKSIESSNNSNQQKDSNKDEVILHLDQPQNENNELEESRYLKRRKRKFKMKQDRNKSREMSMFLDNVPKLELSSDMQDVKEDEK